MSLPLVLLVLLGTIPGVHSQCHSQSFTLDLTKTDQNPLRGFLSYSPENQNKFPSSLEYEYIGMNQLMTGPNQFVWTPLENLLQSVASRNRQLIFRVYIDYPGEPSALPSFLSGIVSMTPYNDYGGGQSPDYENEQLISAIESLIAAMGAQYDGDPRIGFIKVGFLGFWGEWHTYPHEELMASASTMQRVLQAFNNSFSVTQLDVSADQLQYDPPPDLKNYRIGWHDDDFGASTCTQSWGFKNRLVLRNAQDRWKVVPFGGEVQPAIQDTVFSTDNNAATFEQCVEDVPVTWLLNYDLFNGGASMNDDRTRALPIMRKMGYQLYLSQVRVEDAATCSIPGRKCATVILSIRNVGGAPFYYPLVAKVEVDQGFLPADDPEDFQVAVHWSETLTGDIPVTVSLESEYVLRPIKWAVSTVNDEGAVVLDVPSSCGTAYSSTYTSNTATSSGSSTSSTSSSTSSPSSSASDDPTVTAFSSGDGGDDGTDGGDQDEESGTKQLCIISALTMVSLISLLYV